jgi:hypothetical protein
LRTGRDEWFVLVNLFDAAERPVFYIIPRNVVSAVRNVERSVAEPYRERWDLMEGPAHDAPAWLPDLVFEWPPCTGLPAGHPGLVMPSDSVALPTAPRWLTAPLADQRVR